MSVKDEVAMRRVKDELATQRKAACEKNCHSFSVAFKVVKIGVPGITQGFGCNLNTL
jgi:hypothetical protein